MKPWNGRSVKWRSERNTLGRRRRGVNGRFTVHLQVHSVRSHLWALLSCSSPGTSDCRDPTYAPFRNHGRHLRHDRVTKRKRRREWKRRRVKREGGREREKGEEMNNEQIREYLQNKSTSEEGLCIAGLQFNHDIEILQCFCIYR